MIKATDSFIRYKIFGPSIIVTGSIVGEWFNTLSPLLGAATGFALLWWATTEPLEQTPNSS